MARIRRLKVPGEDSFYHVISRTVGQEFLLHDIEKQKLFDIIKRYSGLFFVKVIGHAILSNHWHLILKRGFGARQINHLTEGAKKRKKRRKMAFICPKGAFTCNLSPAPVTVSPLCVFG